MYVCKHLDLSLKVAGGMSPRLTKEAAGASLAPSAAGASLAGSAAGASFAAAGASLAGSAAGAFLAASLLFLVGAFSPAANFALTPSYYAFSAAFCLRTLASSGLGASKFLLRAPSLVIS